MHMLRKRDIKKNLKRVKSIFLANIDQSPFESHYFQKSTKFKLPILPSERGREMTEDKEKWKEEVTSGGGNRN
jgi:hypothetical protein